MRPRQDFVAPFFGVILSEAKDLARASARLFASLCPRRGRRDSYRDGRGSTPAHPPCLFLHSGNSGLRCVKPFPNPLLGQGEGTITQRKQAGDNGAGLLTQVQGLAPAGQGVRLNRNMLAALAFAISIGLSACGTMQQSTTYYPLTEKTAPTGKNVLNVPPEKFSADLVTPAGFKVKTNGQYKTEQQIKAAATAIDRYWSEIRECATTALQTSGTNNASQLVAEFPNHLSIEIANTWKVVEGPATHRRMQAFPSLARPGAWITARREEDELYILVVPELNGLGPQMASELNLWLSSQTTLLTDIASTCSSAPCLRFNYNNAPSQAWNQCTN